MEICFVADNNYKRFLRKYVPKKMNAVPEGIIEDEHGEKIGIAETLLVAESSCCFCSCFVVFMCFWQVNTTNF